MRFLQRTVFGIFIIAICFGSIGYGVVTVIDKIALRNKVPISKPQKTRATPVEIATITPQSLATKFSAYGQIVAWRQLEIKSPIAGRITNIDSNMRNGRFIAAGTILFTLEPDSQTVQNDDAKKALSEILAAQSDTEQALALALREKDQANQHTQLLLKSLERQRSLLTRGVVPKSSVETQEIALTQSMQAALTREQNLMELQQRFARLKLQEQRAGLTIRDSEYQLQQTRINAPFDGSITDSNIALGRNITPNDALGLLIDLTSLEVRFSLTHQQLSLLLDDANRLMQAPVRVAIPIGNRTLETSGQIDRIDAQTPTNQGERIIYAKLNNEPDSILRPGDFVTIIIEGRMIDNASWVPTSAITNDGQMLLIDDDNIVRAQNFPIIQRTNNEVMIQLDRSQPMRFVSRPNPQLRPGTKIRDVQTNGAQTNKESE